MSSSRSVPFSPMQLFKVNQMIIGENLRSLPSFNVIFCKDWIVKNCIVFDCWCLKICSNWWNNLHEYSSLHQVPKDHVFFHLQQTAAVRASGTALSRSGRFHRPRNVFACARQCDQLQKLQSDEIGDEVDVLREPEDGSLHSRGCT